MTTDNRTFLGLVCLVLPALVVSLGSPATGGGFKIQDQSTRAMGMIDAFIAGADDASAVYYNPAGLTRLQGAQTITNVYVAHGTTDYDGPGGRDESDGRYYVVPSFYFGTPVGAEGRFFAGLGVYSPFGLGSKWSDTSPVRHYSKLAEIRLVNINPTVAVQVTDRIAVGAGVDYFASQVKNRYQMPYDVTGDQIPDTEGQVAMDADGDGWGYNLGLQVEVTESVSVGVTYRSQVAVDYDGGIEFDDVPTVFGPMEFCTGAVSQIDFPPTIGVGVCWQASDKLRLELAAEWTKWSTRDRQTIGIDGVPDLQPAGVLVTVVDWEDSWVIMVGGEYALTERWTLRGGYGYNETPVPASTADPSLPTGDTHAVALGLGWQATDSLSLDIAGIVAIAEKQTLNNSFGPRDSDYGAMSAYLSLGLTYSF